jgi:transcriptional regulator of arginine metabolism
MNNMHAMWQDRLRELIREGRYRTQSELVEALNKSGFEATQASISRELKTQRVRKHDGYYTSFGSALPEGIPVLRAGKVSAGTMLFLKTKSAGGPILAQLIDEAEIPGVVATLAGNDTIFVVVDGEAGLKNLSDWVGTDAF